MERKGGSRSGCFSRPTGFPPGMFDFERKGGPKGRGVWRSFPRRKKIQSFQFKWLKWPILTEMTAKYGICFYLLCQQGGGGGIPPVVLGGGGGKKCSILMKVRLSLREEGGVMFSEVELV